MIGVPSFGGRVPNVAAERLSELRGNGARAVAVCVYGNRAYEDTAVELEDLADKAGVNVIGVVAAVAEHSIARRYAAGRPDAEDIGTLLGYASHIADKVKSGDMSVPRVPGDRPYKKPGGGAVVPKPDKHCIKCGVCAAECPVQAIDPSDPAVTDKKKCVSCMRCVAVCPHKARKVSRVVLAAVNAMLKKSCSDRKEYELYL